MPYQSAQAALLTESMDDEDGSGFDVPPAEELAAGGSQAVAWECSPARDDAEGAFALLAGCSMVLPCVVSPEAWSREQSAQRPAHLCRDV